MVHSVEIDVKHLRALASINWICCVESDCDFYDMYQMHHWFACLESKCLHNHTMFWFITQSPHPSAIWYTSHSIHRRWPYNICIRSPVCDMLKNPVTAQWLWLLCSMAIIYSWYIHDIYTHTCISQVISTCICILCYVLSPADLLLLYTSEIIKLSLPSLERGIWYTFGQDVRLDYITCSIWFQSHRLLQKPNNI